MTIEERAKLYASIDTLSKSCDDYFEELSARERECKAYLKGATEQRTIDIDKACEWIINTYLGDYVVDGFGDSPKLAEDLRKALEETK